MAGMLCLEMPRGLCKSLGLSADRSTGGTLLLRRWAVSERPTWKSEEERKERPAALRRAGNSAASAARTDGPCVAETAGAFSDIHSKLADKT